MPHDEPPDVLTRAEGYLTSLRDAGRTLSPLGADDRREEDDPRVDLEAQLARLRRLDRVTEALAPRGGRSAAQLRALLVGERARIFVGLGAALARWVEQGGDVALTMDPDRTRVLSTLASARPVRAPVFREPPPGGSEPAPLGAPGDTAISVVPVAVRAPDPPLMGSGLDATRRTLRPVRAAEPDGPAPDILAEDPGVPSVGAVASEIEAEMGWLDAQGNLLHRWRSSSGPLQHAVLSWLTARARWCQELLGPGDGADAVARLFPKLSAFSKRERPGFVYGLRRDHRAQAESWRDDALGWRAQVGELQEEAGLPASAENPERVLSALERALALPPDAAAPAPEVLAIAEALAQGLRPEDPRLLRLVAPHAAVLGDDPRFRRLRRALRAADEDPDASLSLDDADASFPSDEEDLSAEDAARWSALAPGLRVLIVGGEPREQHRQRLQVALGVLTLEWAPASRGGGVGRLQSTAESIRGGSWDAVILLPRFCGHDVEALVVPACRRSGTPHLHVPGGYGVGPVRAAVRELALRARSGPGATPEPSTP